MVAVWRIRRAMGAISLARKPARACPLPRSSAAAPCNHTLARQAISVGIFCAIRLVMMPVSTSPVPALASPALPVGLV